MGRKTLTDKEYLTSGVWKCVKSPSGAHHWVHMTETMDLARDGYFRCKYCYDVRRFPLSWQQVNPMSKDRLLGG